MSEPEVPFYVFGALVASYIIAATWRSRDTANRPAGERQALTPRQRMLDRRLVHWWRALRRGNSGPSG